MEHFDCPAQAQEYRRWTYDHQKNGRVLVKVDKRFRLHQSVFCDYIFNMAFDPIAQGGRWCFETEREALAYCKRETGRPPLPCGGCS